MATYKKFPDGKVEVKGEFNKIKGVYIINTNDGSMEFVQRYSVLGIPLEKVLFTVDNNNKYDLKSDYYTEVVAVNNTLSAGLNKPILPVNGTFTAQQIRQDFFLSSYKDANHVRAVALNTQSNYKDDATYKAKAKAFFTQGIAGVTDPTTQITSSNSAANKPAPKPVHQTKVVTPAPERNTGASISPDNQEGSQQTTPGLGYYDGEQHTDPNFDGAVAGQGGAANLYFGSDKVGIDKGLNFSMKPKPSAPVPIFRYPKADLSVGKEYGITYDYIKIRCVDYIASLNKTDFSPPGTTTSGATPGGKLEEFNQTIGGLNEVVKRNPSEQYLRNQRTLGYVILPMQPNLSTQNSTGWGEDSANLLQLVTASLANNFLSDTNSIFNMDVIKNHLSTAYQSFKGIGNDAIASRQQIAALLAGYVTSTNILQRTTGTVINPNLEMLFNGPKLRSFNFTFDMAPRFREEANEIRKMIRFFKKYMAPEKDGTRAFLKAPKIFLLDYIYNGDLGSEELEADWLSNEKEHPFLNRFKPCALTNFSVNYTPAGSYMTYRDGGSMTQYQLSFTFSEIEPIYQNDFDGDDNNPPNAGY